MQYAKNDLGHLVRQHNELVNKFQCLIQKLNEIVSV